MIVSGVAVVSRSALVPIFPSLALELSLICFTLDLSYMTYGVDARLLSNYKHRTESESLA